MKQLSIIILAVIAFSTNCMAQDRNNAAPAQLATKSKANEARKSNVKQCTNKPLIKSNKHLLMND